MAAGLVEGSQIQIANAPYFKWHVVMFYFSFGPAKIVG